jgi:hypothetical protein
MPRGYIFVPKGQAFITGHCRRKTLEINKTVYTVRSKPNGGGRVLGIRVPHFIFGTVCAMEALTRADRQLAVKKADSKLKKSFAEAVVSMYPQVPESEIPRIVDRATKKHSKRVGRTGKLDVDTRAKLAVRAHIRHVYTSYDKLLRDGIEWEEAREKTLARIGEVAMLWGEQPTTFEKGVKDRAERKRQLLSEELMRRRDKIRQRLDGHATTAGNYERTRDGERGEIYDSDKSDGHPSDDQMDLD